MRSPLLQKMRQEFDYGNTDFLCGFVQRFYDKREQEFPFGIMAISQIQIDFVLSSLSGI